MSDREKVAEIVNGALLVLAGARRFGVTNELIKARLDSGEPVTADDVQESLGAWQDSIDAGRAQD